MTNGIAPTDQNRDLAITAPLPLSHHPAVVYLSGLTSENSRRTMRAALNNVASILQPGNVSPDRCLSVDWAALRFQHTAAIRARLVETYQPATVNKTLSALRGVLKASWKLGLLGAEEYHQARAVEDVKNTTLPAGRDVDTGEIVALGRACKADKNRMLGHRDLAILAILYTCGLRRAEIVSLEMADIEINESRALIRVQHGKGRKARTVYGKNGALAALKAWLAIRGDQPGAVFNPVLKSGKLESRHMSAQAIYNMLKSRAVESGVADFSPHDMRRTFVGNLLDAGADIVTVQKLAGHASVNTTGRYDRRPEETKEKAAALIHFPV